MTTPSRVFYPGKTITLETARRVASLARCAACDGCLIIDHDPDPHGNGRLHCMACGHDVADIAPS